MAEEKQFETKIKKYLHTKGIYPAGMGEDRMQTNLCGWYTKVWGGGFQKSGIPDILGCVRGRFFSIEIKASSGRPSELQKLNINRIRGSGGIAIFLYPAGFEDFKKLINSLIEDPTTEIEKECFK